jgi:Skp family chaperone for outer membrane proteins
LNYYFLLDIIVIIFFTLEIYYKMPFKLRHVFKAVIHQDNGGHTRVLGVKIGHDLDPIVKPVIIAAAVATVNPGLVAAATAVATSVIVDHAMGAPDNKLIGSALSVACPVAGAIINHGDPVTMIASAVVGSTIGGATGSTIAGAIAGNATAAAINGDNILRAGLQGAGTIIAVEAAVNAVGEIKNAINNNDNDKDDVMNDDKNNDKDDATDDKNNDKNNITDNIKNDAIDNAANNNIEKRKRIENWKNYRQSLYEKINNIDVSPDKHVEFVYEKDGIRIVADKHAFGSGTHGADGVARDTMICESDYPNGVCVRYQETRETHISHSDKLIAQDLYHGETVFESNPCFTVKGKTSVTFENNAIVNQMATEVHVSETCKYVPAIAAAGVALTYLPEVAATAIAGTAIGGF